MEYKAKILVVDDSEYNRDLLEDRLSYYGYDVFTAIDGISALEKIKSILPDLILLDVMLPGIDGMEVCKKIKSDPQLKQIQVIMMTAMISEENVVMGFEAGADDYINKPYELSILLARVRAHLRIKSLQDELTAYLKEINEVANFSRLINTLDLTEILQLVRERLPDLLEIKLFSLFLYYEKNVCLELAVHNHQDLRQNEKIRLNTSEKTVMGDVVNYKKLVFVKEFSNSPYAREELRSKYPDNSALSIPLIVGKKLIGVLNLNGKINSDKFSEQDITIASQVCEHLASAISNCIHYRETQKLSTLDGLTQLYNYRYFMQFFKREFDRALRYQSQLSCVLIDIDFFKKFNDKYGHLEGDIILKNIAARLKKNIRRNDLVARYGGEEFVLVLPETDIKKAVFVAEKIRKAIGGKKISGQDNKYSVTISLGVCGFPQPEIKTKEDLLKAADKAMYKAKAKGRNCTEAG